MSNMSTKVPAIYKSKYKQTVIDSIINKQRLRQSISMLLSIMLKVTKVVDIILTYLQELIAQKKRNYIIILSILSPNYRIVVNNAGKKLSISR